MSPFFRGSVRPAKKHPRAWSLNPRLNPDLDKGAVPRMSILGLPSTDTDVTLPVFNSIYGRKSLDDTKAPVAISVSRHYVLSSPNSMVEEDESAAAQKVPRTAETPAVAEPSKGEARAAETPQLTTTSNTAPPPPAEESTPTPVEDSPKKVAPSAPAEVETPTAPDTLAEQGAAAEDGAPPTPAVAGAEDVFSTPMEEMPAPVATETAAEAQQPEQRLVASPESTGAGAEANLELPVPEPLPVEPALPVIEEEEPAAAAAAESEVAAAVPETALGAGTEAGASTASGLETIEEKPVDETEVATPAPATADVPSEPESAVEEAPAPATEETHDPVIEEAPATATEEAPAPVTPETPVSVGIPAAEEATPAPVEEAPKLAAEDLPSEAPGTSRRLLAVPTAAGDDVPAAATSGSRSSVAGSASAAPSVATINNEEPLMTDEQLEVSDEFKPGVTMVPIDPSH